MTFTQYMAMVDARLIKLCGMDSNCLPDWYYYDYYMDQIVPLECALDAIENANDGILPDFLDWRRLMPLIDKEQKTIEW